MGEPSPADRLIAAVARRHAWRSAFLRSSRVALVCALGYAVVIAAVRWFWPSTAASSPWTDWVEAWPAFTLLAGTALAIGIASSGLRAHRRDPVPAARAIDTYAQCQDLFVARTGLGPDRAGSQRPADRPALATVVEQQAQATAAHIDVAAVMPSRALAVALPWTLAAAVVALALAFAPRQTKTPPPPPVARQDLAKKAQARIDALRQKEVQAPRSPAVESALAELQRAVAELRQDRKDEGRAVLRQVETKLAELWQKAKTDHPRGAGPQGPGTGGAGNREKQATWRKELAEGKVDALRRDLAEVSKLAAAAAQGDAAAGHRAQAAARELKAFARQQGDSALSDAMADLMQQLGTGEHGDSALAKLAERADLELDALQQAAADLAALESALRTGQLADALAQLGGDLAQVDREAALAEYTKALRERLADALEAMEACPDCDGGG